MTHIIVIIMLCSSWPLTDRAIVVNPPPLPTEGTGPSG
jgi:hypothetical protein